MDTEHHEMVFWLSRRREVTCLLLCCFCCRCYRFYLYPLLQTWTDLASFHRLLLCFKHLFLPLTIEFLCQTLFCTLGSFLVTTQHDFTCALYAWPRTAGRKLSSAQRPRGHVVGPYVNAQQSHRTLKPHNWPLCKCWVLCWVLWVTTTLRDERRQWVQKKDMLSRFILLLPRWSDFECQRQIFCMQESL